MQSDALFCKTEETESVFGFGISVFSEPDIFDSRNEIVDGSEMAVVAEFVRRFDDDERRIHSRFKNAVVFLEVIDAGIQSPPEGKAVDCHLYGLIVDYAV